MHSLKKNYGFSIFIGVIVIAAFTLTVGISLITLSTRTLQTTHILEEKIQSSQALNTCVEYALEQIRMAGGRTTNGTRELDGGSLCYFDIVTLPGGNTWQIQAAIQYHNIFRTLQIIINDFRENISITSWNEV